MFSESEPVILFNCASSTAVRRKCTLRLRWIALYTISRFPGEGGDWGLALRANLGSNFKAPILQNGKS